MNKELLSDKGIDEAAEALVAWFISQELSPKDGGPIMIRLLARCIASENRTPGQAIQAIEVTTRLLTLYILKDLEAHNERR